MENAIALITAENTEYLLEHDKHEAAEHAQQKANPDTLKAAIDTARTKLRTSVDLYRSGDVDAAYKTATDAYLLGFEPVEPRLETANHELKETIEEAMNHFRAGIRNNDEQDQIVFEARELDELLEQAEQYVDAAALSSSASAFSAFIILLREGIEAILIIGAMAAFLVKSGRRSQLRWMHTGWIAALLAGIATWFVASRWIDISASNRELTEGITALVAAAILLYVGYWLHRQGQAQRWQQFISSKLKDSTSGKTAVWSLIVVAFLAVYREMFETILFLQTLWLQAGEHHQGIISGTGLAIAVLVIAAWAMFKLNARLPLAAFFRANAVLLFVLAVVFAGQGIYALQEAGTLPFTPISFPQIDLLGIYPDAQSLAVQTMLVVAGLGWFALHRYRTQQN
jgi:high-affinity iron transporter